MSGDPEVVVAAEETPLLMVERGKTTLLAGWVGVIHATSRSLGFGGAILIAAIFGALVWLLIAKGGVFQPHSATVFSHLGLVALSLLLAIGMGWAIVRRKLTGQVEVDTEQR